MITERKLYVGILTPFRLKMRRLEPRQIGGGLRKTWGRKTLWLLKRDPLRILIAESILDALSGEIILKDERITLCSLNGVRNVFQFKGLFVQYRPREVIVALDNDEAGLRATREAFEITGQNSISAVEFVQHTVADVKDLHKVLMLKEEMRYGRYGLSQVRREAHIQ